MNDKLLQVILKDFVIPEAMSFIRDHLLHTGSLPTDEQVLAKLQTDAQRYIDAGQAFLDSKGAGNS
jgi:hypothetical protein